MSKNPVPDDNDLIHENARRDPLAEIYSELATPDIEEMNEHAAALEDEAKIERDQL